MGVVKFILKAILAIFFVALFLFAICLFFVKFRNDTFLGESIKEKVVKSKYLLAGMALNSPGDLGYLYFSQKGPLEVNIFTQEGVEPSSKITHWISDMVLGTVGRGVRINYKIFEGSNMVYQKQDLNILREQNVGKSLLNTNLNIFYIDSYEQSGTNVGLVLHKDSIFIIKSNLDKLSEDVETLERLERSTIMHEWGHLLGLDHIEDVDCVMSEKVEVEDRHFLKEKQISIEYCPETIVNLVRKFSSDPKGVDTQM